MTAATLEAGTRQTPPSLEARLTEWIKAEGIKGHYQPDGIAARVVAQIHPDRLTGWLDQDGTDYLRDMCRRVCDFGTDLRRVTA